MKQKLLVLSLFLFFGHVSVWAQSQEKSFSLLILNFAKNIQWPQYSRDDSFTIGVYNYEPLLSELQKSSAHQRIGSRKIILKEVRYPEEATGCDLLFIPAFKSRSIPEVKKITDHSTTLLVTNTFQNNTLGSNINIILKDGKLTYEIYQASLEGKRLKTSASVRNMGIIINQ